MLMAADGNLMWMGIAGKIASFIIYLTLTSLMYVTHKSPVRVELVVSDHRWAEQFVPNNPTAAIRIGASGLSIEQQYEPLVPSSQYIAQFVHIFDDIDWLTPDQLDEHARQGPDQSEDYVFFSLDRSCAVVQDVAEIIKSIDTLLVHCKYGLSRSPAVAMALNDIFDLGYDKEWMTYEFNRYNEPVYKQMLRAGSYLREQHILTHTR